MKTQPARLRPETIWIDAEKCIECGLCEEVAPGMLDTRDRIRISPQALEAMAVCPTGAIRWLEGEEEA